MKWGHIYEIEPSQRLLYWVLMFILRPYSQNEIDHWLKRILIQKGGLGGDPGWEMEQLPVQEDKGGFYRVWADPEMSGIEPDTEIYSEEDVKKAVFTSLLALKNKIPQKGNEIDSIINRYGLNRNVSLASYPGIQAK